MRIASSTITNMTTGSMSNAYTNYVNIMTKIASNKNFRTVSENPADAAKVLKLNDQIAQLNEYQSNIQAAINEMNLTYDTLGNVADKLEEINGLILEASNATTTPVSAKAIAGEIRQKTDSIKDMMNTKYLDNYIFSGTYIDQITYGYAKVDENGTILDKNDPNYENGKDMIVYQGSSPRAGDRKLTIAENTTFAYNFTGEAIFGKQGSKDEFFAQMDELDKLLNEDPLDYDQIRKKLDVIDVASKNVTQTQGTVSAKVSKLLASQDYNTKKITSLISDKVDIEEVDIAKASTELANAYTQLQASYAISSRILNSISLLDYL